MSKTSDKENCSYEGNLIKGPHLRDILKKSIDKDFSFSENESQELVNEHHEPIVDEVHKTVIHVHRKDKKHIGEEAYMPITLEVLKDTLNRRISI